MVYCRCSKNPILFEVMRMRVQILFSRQPLHLAKHVFDANTQEPKTKRSFYYKKNEHPQNDDRRTRSCYVRDRRGDPCDSEYGICMSPLV